MFEKDLSLSVLFDLYQPLLSQKKREVFEAYFADDLSLSEIADETGTSRQAVRDLIARTAEELRGYEKALGLLQKQKRLSLLCEELQKEASKTEEETKNNIGRVLCEIEKIL